MANVTEISSLDDVRLAAYTSLTEAQLRAKQHAEDGLFIAEGTTVISHALDAGCRPVSFLMERKHIEGKAKGILERCPNADVFTADSGVIEKLTGFPLTRGVLCAMHRPHEAEAEAILQNAHRVAVLEGIVDPTNAGAIFRSAAALGVDAVLLTPDCCDILNRRALRVSMGTVFQVPWARIGKNGADWPQKGMALLKQAGFATAAMALDESAVSVCDERLKHYEKLAVLLGTEGTGLKKETIALCDDTVMIPMSNGVDSLNVAAAACVVFWELCAKRDRS